MTWTNLGLASTSWSTLAGSGMTYTRLDSGNPPWAQVHAQPAGSDNGVDFGFEVRKDGPVIVSQDRPLDLVSSLSEGQP